MGFEVGDEVVYDGSLGKHTGTVTAVADDGAVDVAVPGLPDRLRTDAGSLTAGRLVAGQAVTLDGPRGEAMNIETGVVTPAGQPLPTVPAQPGSTPLKPSAGFAHDDLATPVPGGNDVADPPKTGS
jgi:hypothetical protein